MSGNKIIIKRRMANKVSTLLLHTWFVNYNSLSRFYSKYYWNL